MSEAYRDGDEVLHGRAEALEREVAEASRELEDVRKRIASRDHVRRLNVLDDIRIATPCRADWNEMTGDERVRLCTRCEKNVYDLSAMTRAEAEQLLAEKEDACVRLYRRADGTVITADCPVGVRRRCIVGGAIAGASTLALLTAGTAAMSFFMMGKPARPTATSTEPSAAPMAADSASANADAGPDAWTISPPAPVVR